MFFFHYILHPSEENALQCALLCISSTKLAVWLHSYLFTFQLCPKYCLSTGSIVYYCAHCTVFALNVFTSMRVRLDEFSSFLTNLRPARILCFASVSSLQWYRTAHTHISTRRLHKRDTQRNVCSAFDDNRIFWVCVRVSFLFSLKK